LMGSYLERSIGAFHEAQRKFQEQSQNIYGAAPTFAPDAWTKIMQPAAGLGGLAGSGAVPNMMGDYLEKSASSVIGMQEELRKQAMQMFSTFPFGATPNAKADESDEHVAPAEAPKNAKASTAKKATKPAAKKTSSK
jgi:polyhydroxyalkanoate synthesis regulator protein